MLLPIALVLAVTTAAESQETPRWDRYHDTAETHAMLRGWNQKFPDLVELTTIGTTLRGTPLMVLEITNEKTGPARDKPAYYYDGNIHSDELASGELILYFASSLLTRYGSDPTITELLDTRVLYLRPKFNPDGADVALHTVHNPRSTPRGYDEDGDGLVDEDPPNDLDGDGAITRMLVPSPNGRFRFDLVDGRLIVPRGSDEHGGEYFDTVSEGIDDDGDGAYNEDDVGGIDMNRNFPRNWGMDFEQRGAGPYPLSEPETRATIGFLDTHRNVGGAFCAHTHGGFLYRLPSTTAWDNYVAGDQSLILELADAYEQSTGNPVRPSYSNPRVHRHGTLISWLYWDYGVVGFVPELWSGYDADTDGDGKTSEIERLTFDASLGSKGFAQYTDYDHPQLGSVKIGGWRRKFTMRNPPGNLLEAELRRYLPWMIWLARIGPRVIAHEPVVEDLADRIKRVELTVENIGYLPTNISLRALENHTAKPVRVTIETEGCELVSGKSRRDLGHLSGRRTRSSPEDSRSRLEVSLRVREGAESASVRFIVESEKGGRTVRVARIR